MKAHKTDLVISTTRKEDKSAVQSFKENSIIFTSFLPFSQFKLRRRINRHASILNTWCLYCQPINPVRIEQNGEKGGKWKITIGKMDGKSN